MTDEDRTSGASPPTDPETLERLSEWYGDRPPETVAEFHRPSGYTYYVVVDSTAIPAYFDPDARFGKGGLRYSSELDRETMAQLARRMTLKNALPGDTGLYGGAKAGIKPPDGVEPDGPPPDHVVEDFARTTWPLHHRNGGPWGGPGCDVNFDETCIERYLEAVLDAGLTDDVRVATGRPSGPTYLGAAYDEHGAAGRGVARVLEVVREVVAAHPDRFPEVPVADRYDVAIQGLGAMGSAVATRLDEFGHRVVAAGEASFGASVIDEDGLDVDRLLAAHESGSLDGLDGTTAPLDEVLYADCDVLIPAATGDVVTSDNVDRVEAPVVVEAANFPLTDAARRSLYERGTLVVPGESANFGGSVAASVELDPSVESDVVAESLDRTDRFVERHTRELLSGFLDAGGFDSGCSPHLITNGMALSRVVTAMADRGDRLPDEIRDLAA